MNREDFGARLSQPQRAKMQKIALSPNSEAETADYADDTDKQAWRRNRPDEFEGRAVNKTRLSSVQSAQSVVLISVFGFNPRDAGATHRFRSEPFCKFPARLRQSRPESPFQPTDFVPENFLSHARQSAPRVPWENHTRRR